MIKRMNKKGDTTWQTIIPAIMGVAILALVILFALGFFNKAEALTKTDIEVAVQSEFCEALSSRGNDFCTSYITTKKENLYTNCPYAIKNLGVTISSTAPNCDTPKSEIAICNRLEIEDKKFSLTNTIVNDNSCGEWYGFAGTCSGTITSCAGLDREKCAEINKCIFADSTSTCTGDCKQFTSKDSCEANNKDGCGWTPKQSS
jgi:hypothetical protein